MATNPSNFPTAIDWKFKLKLFFKSMVFSNKLAFSFSVLAKPQF
jgi:hypothetical protein